MSKIDKAFDSINAVFLDLIGDHERAKLIRGDLDESPSGDDVIEIGEWPGRLRPRGSDYRIVRYQNGMLGMQSKVKDGWADVRQYQSGFDDYGRLDASRWKRMSDCCRWSESGLRLLRERLLGIVREPEVL